MDRIKVTLLQATDLSIADIAIGKCWGKGEIFDPQKMKDRMERVALKNKHESTIEHIVYSFEIDGISRACLQELARHRIQSLSVKSTRYTLKELKKWSPSDSINLLTSAKTFIVMGRKDRLVDVANANTLLTVRELLLKGLSNDEVKYALPEAYRTSLVSTFNARSLRNFLKLRLDKSALEEIRHLANLMYEALPLEHMFLYKDCFAQPYTKEDSSE